MLRHLKLIPLLAVAAVAASPATALAKKICVAKPNDCPGGSNWGTLEAALADAAGTPERDTIEIAAGEFAPDGGTRWTVNTSVDIVGAGVGQTILKASDASWTFNFQLAAASIGDLTIKAENPATAFALVLNGADATRIHVDSVQTDPGDTGLLVNGAGVEVTDSTISVPVGDATKRAWAIWISNSVASGTFTRVNLVGDNAIVSDGGATSKVFNSRARAHRAFVARNGTLLVDNTLLDVVAGASATPIGFHALNDGNGNTILVRARNVTARGPGSGSVGAFSEVFGTPGGSASVEIRSTILSNFGEAAKRTGAAANSSSNCPPDGSAATNSANINYRYSLASNVFNNTGTGGCFHWNWSESISSNSPSFVSATDARLRGSSPAIDRGDPAAPAGDEPTTDLEGLPRVVDGNGSGAVQRDIGAFEYQRRPPTVSASSNPMSGPLSTVFGFTASASDPDGDATTFVWVFDDGQASAGATVNKTFSTFGDHTGTVKATDEAGLLAQSAVTVTVADPPVPQPSPAPPPDTSAPIPGLPSGTIKVDSKRVALIEVSCPASEVSGPCTIAVLAETARKVALKRRGKKAIQKLGQGSATVQPGQKAKIRIKLSKKLFAYLKRVKRLPVNLKAGAADAKGNKASATKKVTFKAPKTRRRR